MRLFHYSGNDEDGWPYRVNGSWDYFALIQAFQHCNTLCLSASPWCDVLEAREALMTLRAAFPLVTVLAVIQGPNGWNGAREKSEAAFGSEPWFWRRMCEIKDQFPLRLPNGDWQQNVNIDIREPKARHEMQRVFDDVVRSGVFDDLFLDQWYLGINWLGFTNVDDAEWSEAMQFPRSQWRRMLFVNTGGHGRIYDAVGQMFENWPWLPIQEGGLDGVKSLVRPDDVLSIVAPQFYDWRVSANTLTRAKALTVYHDALELDAYAAVVSSPLKDGRKWDQLRGHAPWSLR